MKIYEDKETGLTYQFSADAPFIPSHLIEVTAPQKVEATATAEESEATQEKAAEAPKNKARKTATK